MDHARTGITSPDAAAAAAMDAALLLEPKLEQEPLLPLSQLMPPPLTPRPLEAPQLPPFLSKTYDLVSEPALDGVISWGAAGNTFVVWDPSTFARDVLPHHFKHNNFCSFVRQLNTYGFRKVHADRWEFAHEDFLRHRKHLLKKIVRRRSSPTQQSGLQSGPSGELSLDPELHTLRREKSALLQEVSRLKQEHRQTIEHMSTLNQRLESAEDRQKQMVSFLAKLLQNPTFLRQLKLHREQKEIESTRVKRKFLKHVPHGHTDSGESSTQHTGESGLQLPAYSPMPPGAYGDIEDLQNFLLEDMDLNLVMLPDNIGLDGVQAPEGVGALVEGFGTRDEHDLGTGAELLEMPPVSGPLGPDPTIVRSKGKSVFCPGLDGISSSDCLGLSSDNLGVLSGTMLETTGQLMAADDQQIWDVDASAALQSSCSSLATDPYLMEIANKPEKFWDLDFQALDEGDLQLDKCAIDDPILQQHRDMNP